MAVVYNNNHINTVLEEVVNRRNKYDYFPRHRGVPCLMSRVAYSTEVI